MYIQRHDHEAHTPNQKKVITATRCIGYAEIPQGLGRHIDIQALRVTVILTGEDYWDQTTLRSVYKTPCAFQS